MKGAIVGGLLTSGSSKSWWVEIALTDQSVHYYRLFKESDHDVFLKWAEKYGVKVEASNNGETAEASGLFTSAADEILKYKQLWDIGILTEEEFEAKKKQLLDL